MGSGRKTPNICKIQIKGDKKTLFLTDLLPDYLIGRAGKSFIGDSVALMPHLPEKFSMGIAQVFIQFNEHCKLPQGQ